jgi:hypothetical protein
MSWRRGHFHVSDVHMMLGYVRRGSCPSRRTGKTSMAVSPTMQSGDLFLCSRYLAIKFGLKSPFRFPCSGFVIQVEMFPALHISPYVFNWLNTIHHSLEYTEP